MQLRDVIESPCGLRYMIDNLDVKSNIARRSLLDTTMMTHKDDIEHCHDILKHFMRFVNETDKVHLNTIQFKLQGLKDINSTLKHLRNRQILNDIELFEVKHLAMLSNDILSRIQKTSIEEVVTIPEMTEVIDALDPDGLRIATFYIYDSYSPRLKELRAKMTANDEIDATLLAEAEAEEDIVRTELSRKLSDYAIMIEKALLALVEMDINIAKALQISDLRLDLPIVADNGTRYVGLFNPQIKEILKTRSSDFQPVDIAFGNDTTMIIGANMGGKTVVLKTLTLCQYLFQFGFGIPASSASIEPKDEIYFCIGDEQSMEQGLSSFAAEMKNIDTVIKASRKGNSLLALIDEPARTTNPIEGTALVASLINVLGGDKVSLVMTTHYDIESSGARCLRVKGFANGKMNYQLVEVQDGEVPHEALNIAESLDIDKEWIMMARKKLNFSSINDLKRIETNHP